MEVLEFYMQLSSHITMTDKIEKVKKRKRNTEESSTSRKKVALDEDSKIKISVAEADRWLPVVGKSICN
jgi:hypothetical protein